MTEWDSVTAYNYNQYMSEYRRKRRNIRSNEMNKKLRALMSRTNEENRDLVSVSADGSHEELGGHK